MHSIGDWWVSGLQECKCNEFFSEIGRVANNFQWGLENLIFGRAAVPARF